MSEISRISPSEVKPSVEVGKGGGRAGHKHLTRDNTGTTRTHISGAAPKGLSAQGQWEIGRAWMGAGERWDLLLGVGQGVRSRLSN